MLEKMANKQECEDTEEMMQWRNVNQEGKDASWRELCDRREEEVL